MARQGDDDSKTACCKQRDDGTQATGKATHQAMPSELNVRRRDDAEHAMRARTGNDSGRNATGTCGIRLGDAAANRDQAPLAARHEQPAGKSRSHRHAPNRKREGKGTWEASTR